MKRLSSLFTLPFLPLLVAVLVLFGPILFAGKALFWGTPMLQFVPWWSWAWETLLSGHLPLWNPLLGMGAPLLANYQSALLYPPNWIYFLLFLVGKVPAVAWGQALMVAIHLLWAGSGMACLARRLGLGVLAQAVAGLAFGLSGYLVARAGFLSINAAAAWLPWILLCLTPEPEENRPSRRRLLLLALCLALQLLAGHAQTTWYTWILAGLWAGYLAVAAYSRGAKAQISGESVSVKSGFLHHLRAASGRVLRAWGFLALALLLAVGLSAAQLLPTGEYLLQSQRAAAVDYETAMTYSFWPWRLVTLLAPGFFGSPVQGDYWGYANFWEDAIYVGLLPFLLVLAAVLRRKPKPVEPVGEAPVDELQDEAQPGMNARPAEQRRINPAEATPLMGRSSIDRGLIPRGSASVDSLPPLRWFLLALFGLALLLALGKNMPVFPWLYQHVPTFSLFQAPARYMIWAVFALALLAAMGVERWQRPEARGLYWTRLGTMGAAAVTIGAGLAWYFMGDISPSFIRATAIAGALGVVSGALSLTAPPRPGSEAESPTYPLRAWQWAVALFIALDLVIAGWGLNPGVEMEVYSSSSAIQEIRTRLAGQRVYITVADEYALKYERFLLFDTFDPGEDWMNMRAALLPNVNMLDGLASSNNFDPLVPGHYAAWMEFLDQLDANSRLAYLQMMNVGLVEEIDPLQPSGVRFEPLEGGWRARWVPCVEYTLDPDEAWDTVTNGQVDFATHVVLQAGLMETEDRNDCLSDTSSQMVTSVDDDGPNRLTMRVSTEAAGWLVLSDVWYPGWLAWVDDKPEEILLANTLFRAVYLPPGVHDILFEYRPLSLGLGVVVSLFFSGLLVFLWRRWRAAK